MTELPPPRVAAHERPTDEVLPAAAYRVGDEVWVWRHDSASWRPGVVIGTGLRAAIVSYWPTGGRGELTDTVMQDRLAPRAPRDGEQPGP